jgi:beta-glucuronidase
MLKPITTVNRTVLDCSGFWKFKIDPNNLGEVAGWERGLISDIEIAVPGSWNEQLAEAGLMNYVGVAWYEKEVVIPKSFEGKSVRLYVGSVDFQAKVWVDGHFLGTQSFGFLPFELDLTPLVEVGKKIRITMRVSNELSEDSVPQGISQSDYIREHRVRDETFPPARFDFFPFGGIQRPVYLVATNPSYFTSIKVQTHLLTSSDGEVRVCAEIAHATPLIARFSIAQIQVEVPVVNGTINTQLIIPNCTFWSCETPHLYTLRAELLRGDEVVDDYDLAIGIREVKIEQNQMLLNGKRIFLRGFGKHEDAPIHGRGLNLPQIVKDFGLMKWINANSFRTSHYPYAEEWLDFADRHGILVISEVADISRDFRKMTDQSLLNHKAFLSQLIARDFNHPSVIAWSISNEPNYLGEAEYHDGRAETYWKELTGFARQCDTSRPLTMAHVQRATLKDPALKFVDFISLNRYYGWYENPAQLDVAAKRLSEELDEIARLYNKPILISEFGADTVAGFHSTTDQLFTEEYQSNLIRRYCEVIESKSFTIGEHVWNFADFRTPQHHRRVVLNLKGVFTRTREPKLAAFTLKEIWHRQATAFEHVPLETNGSHRKEPSL